MDKIQRGDLKFSERLYISKIGVHHGYGLMEELLAAVSDLDQAVPVGDETEVGIYQLVRVAKFKKTAVEVKTLREITDVKNKI